MKKILLFLALFAGCSFVFAKPVPFDFIHNEEQAVYTPSESKWTLKKTADDSIVLAKTLIEGTGSYSVYNYPDGSLAFALSTDTEFIRNGQLIVVDNNLLKYSKIVYDGLEFEQIPMSIEEIQTAFPNAEIFKISGINEENKVSISKPLFRKKIILLVNDTDRYFHRLKCKSKKVQNPEIKGLLTFSRYGFFKFTHLGERNGKIKFCVR